MERAGLAAINLGVDERNLGATFLASIPEVARLPWVRTNPPAAGSPWPGTPTRRVRLGRDTLVIAGLSTVAGDPPAPSPAEALRPVAATVRAGERLVVLLQGKVAAAGELARAVTGIDLIVADGGDSLDADAHRVGHTLVVSTGTDGKWLGAIALQPGPLGVDQVHAHPLGEDIPDDPPTAGLVADYYRALKEAQVLREAPPTPTVGGSFTGAAACQQCHPDAFDIWRESAHAHALDTLVARGKEGAPECVPCHTLGFGYTGGFVDAETSPARGGVQCENCHGVGSNHAVNPTSDYGRTGEATCRACHTEEQSTGFAFQPYWEQIFH
jgi:hypothetical protein